MRQLGNAERIVDVFQVLKKKNLSHFPQGPKTSLVRFLFSPWRNGSYYRPAYFTSDTYSNQCSSCTQLPKKEQSREQIAQNTTPASAIRVVELLQHRRCTGCACPVQRFLVRVPRTYYIGRHSRQNICALQEAGCGKRDSS